VSKRRGQREGVKRIPLLGKKVKHKRDEDYWIKFCLINYVFRS
jgi:hypothetical protein